MPKVSVLTVVYNGQNFLAQSIESILTQSLTDFEFLIVDNGSSDGTPEIVKGYNDERIKYYRLPSNLGLTKGLNYGLTKAKSPYIAILDHDDLSLPTRLEKELAVLEDNPDIGLVYSARDLIDKEGQIIDSFGTLYSSEDIFYTLHFRNCIVHSAVMFRLELVTNLGKYNEHVERAQDFELFNRLSKHSRIFQIPESLAQVRVHDARISSRFSIEQLDSVANTVISSSHKYLGVHIGYDQAINLTKYAPEEIVDFHGEVWLLARIQALIKAREREIISNLRLNHRRLNSIMKRDLSDYVRVLSNKGLLSMILALYVRIRLSI